MNHDDGETYLSADELRKKLYNSLKNRGYVDVLKSQLRSKLVEELAHTSASGDLSRSGPKTDDTLLLRAANSLIVNHLQTCQYDYSLSVFLPEANISQSQAFSLTELMDLLHIHPESKLYQSVTRHGARRRGFLWQLLRDLSAAHQKGSSDTSTQADLGTTGSLKSVDSQLAEVERQYNEARDELYIGGRAATEQRILGYERTLDTKYREHYRLEIERFKENEIRRIRLEEREKLRVQHEKDRKEMEYNYRKKHEELQQRDQNSTERISMEREIQEKELYNQRQSLLAEVESLRAREAALTREKEALELDMRSREQTVFSRNSQLDKREQMISRNEAEYSTRLHNEIARYKLESDNQHLARIRDVETKEAKYREEKRVFDEEKTQFEKLKRALHEAETKSTGLEAKLYEAKMDAISAIKKCEVANEKIRDMVDYKTLREDNAVLRHELDHTKLELAKLQHVSAGGTLPGGGPGLVQLGYEADRARGQLGVAQTLHENERHGLKQKLDNEVLHNVELMQQYDAQSQQQREMNQELVDLRTNMLGLRKALANELHVRPRLVEERRSQCSESSDQLSEHTSLLETPPRADRRGDDNALSGASPQVADRSQTSSIDVVEDTRARLKRLETEADSLEQHYRTFQQRLLTAPSLPSQDPFTSSLTTEALLTARQDARERNRHSSPSRVHFAPGVSGTAFADVRIQPGSKHSSAPSDLVAPTTDLHVSDLLTSKPPMRLSMTDLQATGDSNETGIPAAKSIPDFRPPTELEPLAPVTSLDAAWSKRDSPTDPSWRKPAESTPAADTQTPAADTQAAGWAAPSLDSAWKSRATAGESKAESIDQPSPVQAEDRAADDVVIDPIMQQYMDKVQQQKDREKQVTKKAVSTWSKGHSFTRELDSDASESSEGHRSAAGISADESMDSW